MKKDKKKSGNNSNIILSLLSALIGGICGLVISKSGLDVDLYYMSFGEYLLYLLLMFVLFVVAIYIQIILHEGGHCIFGLATGYEFLSFRIGNIMLAKDNGKFVFKKYSLAGTSGQCIMIPPEMKDGKIPYALYNFGGVIANLVVTLACIPFVMNTSGVIQTFLICLALSGLAFALTNGIPMKTKSICNDGYNALYMGRDKNAIFAFWATLKIHGLACSGVSLADMDSSLFELPSDADMHNPIISSLAVFQENRLLALNDFENTKKQINYLLSDDVTIVGVYKSYIQSDKLFIEILENGKSADVSLMEDKLFVNSLKASKSNPSSLRTYYAYYKVIEENKSSAEKMLSRFSKIAKSYPIKSDIAIEMGLIEMINKKYN